MESDLFADIGIGVRYRRARRGHLAERSWLRRARLRVLREVRSTPPEGNPRTFRVGEIVEMVQAGPAGHEVRRDTWSTNLDLGVTVMLHAEDVKVLEVLEEHPPFGSARRSDPAGTAIRRPERGTIGCVACDSRPERPVA